MTPQAPHHESAEDPLLPIALAIGDGIDIDWTRIAKFSREADRSTGELAGMRRLEQLMRGHKIIRGRTSAPDSPAYETLLTEARRGAASTPLDALRVRWGPLEVLEKVGSGAFGDVYRAWEPRLQREVALKLIPDAAPADVATPVIEEGRLLARVRHPNVLTVHGAERIDGRVGIWTEFVRGETLAAEVARRGQLPVREAAAIGGDVARALAAVHAAGVLHRDVKAENVMRDENGRVVLGDFGIGATVEEPPGETPRVPAGTPVYLAPEVLAAAPATAASDLYSLGVLLYFLSTGEYPVRGGGLQAIRLAHQTGQRIPIDQHRRDLPPAFVALVNALLDPLPAQRPANAAAVVGALTGVLAGLESSGRRRLVLWFCAAGALAITGAGVAVVSFSSTGATDDVSAADVLEETARQIVDPPCMGAPQGDGRWMVCVEDASHLDRRGRKSARPLVRFSIDTGQMEVLYQPTTPAQIESVVVASDGRFVAFAERAAPQRAIVVRLLETGTGSVRALAEWPPGTKALVLNGWHSVDERLSARLWRADNTQAFVLLSVTSGAVEREFDFPGFPQGFSRSPDGRRLAFDVLQVADRPERDIRVCDLTSEGCANVASHPGHDFYPIWAGDDRLLFNSDRSGLLGLYLLRFDPQGHPTVPRLVREVGRGLRPIGITGDGTLFAQIMLPRFDAQLIDLSGGTAAPTTVRLTGPASYESKSPVWSPDGDRLAYVAVRGPFAGDPGAMRVVVRSIREGREHEFAIDMALATRLAWSPDGTRLAVVSVFDVGSGVRVPGIRVVDAVSGREVRSLPGPVPGIAWLDSQTLLNAAGSVLRGIDVETGGERIIWRPSPPELIRKVAVSPDGAWLAATVGPTDSSAILVLPSNGGATRELLREPGCWGHAWSRDGAAILVTRRATDPVGQANSQLWLVPVDGSAPQPLPIAADELEEVHPHPTEDRYVFTARRPASPTYWRFTGLTR